MEEIYEVVDECRAELRQMILYNQQLKNDQHQDRLNEVGEPSSASLNIT